MRIKVLNSYTLATYKYHRHFRLHQFCFRPVNNTFSLSYSVPLACFLCLLPKWWSVLSFLTPAFSSGHPEQELRVKVHLLHLPTALATFFFHQYFGRTICLILIINFAVYLFWFSWMVFRDIRSNAFYSSGFSRLSKWKAFISCLLVFLSSKVFWLIFL